MITEQSIKQEVVAYQTQTDSVCSVFDLSPDTHTLEHTMELDKEEEADRGFI